MGQEEQTAELYDFLYRDTNRIASLYAQLFKRGKLSSAEETDSNRRAVDKSGRVALALAGGEVKHSSDIQTTAKRVFDPHDVIITDVLAELAQSNHIFKGHIEKAPHGSLVLVEGTLTFVDSAILAVASKAVDAVLPKGKTNQQLGKLIKAVLDAVKPPSAFLLRMNDSQSVVGTIKDAGMEEPINTYHFKHGEDGLPSVYLVGIKEASISGITVPDTALIGATRQLAKALQEMLFPPTAHRVTPLALYRKLLTSP